MSQSRRQFVKAVLSGIALTGLGSFPVDVLARQGLMRLTVLHTNDVHSRIDPFPSNDPKWPGMGGVARRAALIEQIRKQENNVLLLDAGDIVQGTPYFNMFGGEVEFKAMSRMGYDAATLGNHDFDNGIDGLLSGMQHMNFPFLNANYSFDGTALENKIPESRIFKKGNLKIGVFGVGIELSGLVDRKNFGDIRYNDPIATANRVARKLKHEDKCDLIICLSHLGYKYNDSKVSDVTLASQSEYIDLIIGGHTHTFLDRPERRLNKQSKEVLIAQVGWAGIKLGRVDFYFDVNQTKKVTVATTVKISENTRAS